jgi:hypothetical protein
MYCNSYNNFFSFSLSVFLKYFHLHISINWFSKRYSLFQLLDYYFFFFLFKMCVENKKILSLLIFFHFSSMFLQCEYKFVFIICTVSFFVIFLMFYIIPPWIFSNTMKDELIDVVCFYLFGEFVSFACVAIEFKRSKTRS